MTLTSKWLESSLTVDEFGSSERTRILADRSGHVRLTEHPACSLKPASCPQRRLSAEILAQSQGSNDPQKALALGVGG
jgi:hypothetical protein